MRPGLPRDRRGCRSRGCAAAQPQAGRRRSSHQRGSLSLDLCPLSGRSNGHPPRHRFRRRGWQHRQRHRGSCRWSDQGCRRTRRSRRLPERSRSTGPASSSAPGIIDIHSHLGDYASPGVDANSDGNEATDPVHPDVWAEHSVWPQDPGFSRALVNGGVTTLQILPGSANLFGGRSVVLKNVPAEPSRR